METNYEWAKESKLTKNQKKSFVLTGKDVLKFGYSKVKIEISYDDECNNGHNTLAITGTYWAKEGNLESARKCAIWEDGTLEQLKNENELIKRLPSVMKEFREIINNIGFVY